MRRLVADYFVSDFSEWQLTRRTGLASRAGGPALAGGRFSVVQRSRERLRLVSIGIDHWLGLGGTKHGPGRMRVQRRPGRRYRRRHGPPDSARSPGGLRLRQWQAASHGHGRVPLSTVTARVTAARCSESDSDRHGHGDSLAGLSLPVSNRAVRGPAAL
jgi:hypothetical protein